MFNIDFTFLWAAVNLLVIYLFAKLFLFKRLGAYMDKRADNIATGLAQGDALKIEYEQFRQEREAFAKSMAEQQRVLLEDAKSAAERERTRIISEARQEAARIVNEAHAETAREQERMKHAFSGEVATIAIAAASRVIENNMDSEQNRTLVERFLAANKTGGAA